MNKLMNRVFTLALLLLFVFSQSYLIADSFNLSVSAAAPIWIAALCLSVWLAGVFRHGIFLSLPLSAGLLYLAYRSYSPELSAELLDVLDKLAGAYYEHFYAPGTVYAYAGVTKNQTMVFIFAAFLIASYMITALTAKSTRVSLSMLGSLPLFFCCVAVNGTPNPLLIIGMLLFWALLFVGGGSYDAESVAWRSMLTAALPSALLLVVLLLLFSPTNYSYTDEDVARTLRVNKIAALLRGEDIGSDPNSDSPGENIIEPPAPAEPYSSWRSDGAMALDQAYSTALEDTVFLRAKSDSEGYIYLRGSSYGDYAGSDWLPAVEPEQSSSLDFAARAANAADGAEHELELRYVSRVDSKFMPYYSLSGSPSDVRAISGGGQRQNTRYKALDMSTAELPEDIVQAEAEYRPFAHEYYTALPESTRSALLALAAENSIGADSADVISQVAEFVRGSGEYDLGVEPYPADDIAVYFLTQANRGYCVHFATAAAAMYRALDIPARVTEGFLFYAEAGKWTDITGANAHAWVEVYKDGLGWIPVEVTPSGGEDDGIGAALPEETQPVEESPTPDDEPTPTIETPEPTKPVENSRPAGIISGEPTVQSKSEPARSFPWKAVAPVLVAALVIAFIVVRRQILVARSRAKRRGRDSNRAAIELWRVCEKLNKYGADPPEQVKNCAEKAAFSPHTVDREDIKLCRRLVDELISKTYAPLKPLRKLRFKYIDCIM